MHLSPADLEGYRDRGYHLARGLFSGDEIARVLAAGVEGRHKARLV